MTISRRQFLTRALASVPVVLAGEQLIELLAPHKTIFLPPRGGWIAAPETIWDSYTRVYFDHRVSYNNRYPDVKVRWNEPVYREYLRKRALP